MTQRTLFVLRILFEIDALTLTCRRSLSRNDIETQSLEIVKRKSHRSMSMGGAPDNPAPLSLSTLLTSLPDPGTVCVI
jgi:hypothetical protein